MDIKSKTPRRLLTVSICSLLVAQVGWCGSPIHAQREQDVTVVDQLITSGTVQSFLANDLTIVDADGKPQAFKIQRDENKPMSVAGGTIALNEMPNISISGTASTSALERGTVVEIDAEIGSGGKTGKVFSIKLLPLQAEPAGIQFKGDLPKGRRLVRAKVSGLVDSFKSNRLVLAIPKHKSVPRGRLNFKLDGTSQISAQLSSLENVEPGDVITDLKASEISSGELIVRSIQIQKVKTIDRLRLTIDQQLWLKYRHRSDEPFDRPRNLRSKHFVIKTDISDRSADILLEKLEIMVGLVSDYYGKTARQPIYCIVVDDILRWDSSELDQNLMAKVRNGEGITVYRRLGRQEEAIVYSVANHAVVQHEAVHAFCFLTFGNTGPLWYAEGMAEVGQYWIPGETAVHADPAVIGYLRASEPRNLLEIVAKKTLAGEETWKAYAWRWALCHLLAHNPNYSPRFKKLGLNMMGGGRETFQSAYGDVANEISFEYKQFLEHVCEGYRADLAAWQWDVVASVLGVNRSAKTKATAARGWQATPIEVQSGGTYHLTSKGKWTVEANSPAVDADGDAAGRGKLLAVIFSNYQLGKVFEIGADGSFTADRDGQLYLRCQDLFGELADNQGEMTVQIKREK